MGKNARHVDEHNNQHTNQQMLWQDFKKGDRHAFNTLLQQYYPRLLNYGVRLVSDTLFVEDTLQDLFMELWQKRAGLGDVQNINAYLVSSFRRRLLREKEKNNRLGIVSELSDNYDFHVQFDIETQLIGIEQESETHDTLKKHLDKLTKRQREAIYLRFYQGLEYVDIAQIMAINQHSAVNLVYDALRLLRQNWTIALLITLSYFF
jgi:RNA polymerase sigma factor (sigma-70 family)